MLVIATVTAAWGAPSGYLGWAVLASICGSSGLALYYRALAIGTMGVVSPIAALGVLVPLGVGLADGERPTSLQMIGIAMALLGVVAASGPEVHGDAGWTPVALAAGAAVLLGGALVGISRGSEVSVVMTMTAMRITTVTLMAIVLLLLRKAVPLRRGDGRWLVAIGLLDVGANLAFGVASTIGLLTLVAVFGSLYPVFTILLARWLDHERLRPIQVAGVSLALAGVAAISAG